MGFIIEGRWNHVGGLKACYLERDQQWTDTRDNAVVYPTRAAAMEAYWHARATVMEIGLIDIAEV